MDKFILLTYTCIGTDGYRHSGHAWFATKEEMLQFIDRSAEKKIEVDVAIEILSYKEIEI